MKSIKFFILVFVAFVIGLFFGEWLVDLVLGWERSALDREIIEALLAAFIASLLFSLFIRRYRRG